MCMYDPNDLNNKEPNYVTYFTFKVVGIVVFVLIAVVGTVAGAYMGQLLSGFLMGLGTSLIVYGIVFMSTRH